MDDIIASTVFDYALPDGTRGSLRAWVGKPDPDPRGDFGCPCGIDIIKPELVVLFGVDAFQALTIALRFVGTRLRDEMAKGMTLYYPDDTEPISIESLQMTFGLLNDRQAE